MSLNMSDPNQVVVWSGSTQFKPVLLNFSQQWHTYFLENLHKAKLINACTLKLPKLHLNLQNSICNAKKFRISWSLDQMSHGKAYMFKNQVMLQSICTFTDNSTSTADKRREQAQLKTSPRFLHHNPYYSRLLVKASLLTHSIREAGLSVCFTKMKTDLSQDQGPHK